MAAHPMFSWRGKLDALVLGAGIGLGAGFLISLSNPPGVRWISWLYGALVGVGITVIARSVERLFRARFEAMSRRQAIVAFAALFAVSGTVSWVLAALSLNLTFGLHIPVFSRGNLLSIGITVGLAVTCGLAIASFERMKELLAESAGPARASMPRATSEAKSRLKPAP